MPYFQSNTALLEQLKGQSNNSLLYKCASIIEDLQQQVEHYLKINEEQKRLVEILQKGKQYYENQYNSHSFDQQLIKIQQQCSHMSSLLSIHQKENHELKFKITQLEQKISQKEKTIQTQSQQIQTINLQKLILQKQWNRVVKAVKRKIAKIVEQGHHNPQNKENYNYINKENILTIGKSDPIKVTFNSNSKGKQQPRGGLLMERVDNMIGLINQKLAISELENILTEANSTQKKKNNEGLESQKEYNELPYKIEFY